MSVLSSTFRDRAILWLFAIVCSLLPGLIIFAHRGVAPALLLLGVGIALQVKIWRRGVDYFLTNPEKQSNLFWIFWIAIAFSVWAALSTIWSPRGHGFSTALTLIGPLLASGAVVFELCHRKDEDVGRIARYFTYAGGAAIILMVIEALSSGALRALAPPDDVSPNRFFDQVALGRGTTIICQLLFPVLLLIYQRTQQRALLGILFIAVLYASLRFDTLSNAVSLMVAAPLFFLALKWPKYFLRLIFCAIVVVLLAAPAAVWLPVDDMIALFSDMLPASSLQRIAVWQFTASHAVQCLPIGCGAEYARELSVAAPDIQFPGSIIALSLLPTHPHNLFLQVWLELGVPGVLLLVGLFYFFYRELSARDFSNTQIALIVATLTSIFISALFEMSIWQVWRLSTAGFAAVLIAIVVKNPVSTGR